MVAQAAALVVIWTTAVAVVMACALTALLGRAQWGDGEDPAVSLPGVVGLAAIAVAAFVAAIWLTRLVGRRR